MFVLLVGLMGIGAMIPAGRYEIMQGVKTDYATTVGRAAFRDIKARGMMDPRTWRDNANAAVFTPPLTFSAAPWVIDPLGLTASPTSFGSTFPFVPGSSPTLARIRPSLGTSVSITAPTLFDPIFRCSDDVLTTPDPTRRDAPPTQLSFRDALNNPIRRSSEGNYSWLATIVPDPTVLALSSKMTVSVAVFYKRNLSSPGAGESALPVTFPALTFSATGQPFWNNEIRFTPPTGTPSRALRPGQWVMLAGGITTPPPPISPLNYFRWYRVASASPVDPVTLTQDATLAGTDWTVLPTQANPSANPSFIWMIDGVIAVYEKNLRLEVE